MASAFPGVYSGELQIQPISRSGVLTPRVIDFDKIESEWYTLTKTKNERLLFFRINKEGK
jgi:hypothetical protein